MKKTLQECTKEFSAKIVILCRKLKSEKVEYSLIDQLMRSGTSIGANVSEAHYAQGAKDFISKFEIALKECNETDYWIGLLHTTDSISEEDFKSFTKDIINIRRMLVSSIKTLKAKI